MDRKKLFKILFYLVFLIFILNLLAEKFHWYLSIWYFDMTMHFLGGFWLGLFFIWLFGLSTNPSLHLIIKILSGVLLIGIFWEFFELLFVNHVAQHPFSFLDTLSDMCFDLAGGLGAIFYIWKFIMPTSLNTVQLK